MEQRKCKLPEAILVRCFDVRVLLERLCGEQKLELGNRALTISLAVCLANLQKV